MYQLSGQPVLVFYHHHCEKFLPYIQSTSALFQFKTITPCPIKTGPTKKFVLMFPINPLSVLNSCNKVSLEPCLLQAEVQLSQHFLLQEVFHPSDHFCGSPLDLLLQLHASSVLRAAELDAILQVGSHQSRVEEQNHLS